MEKYPKFHGLFKQLGEDWKITTELYENLEEFTCLMYGQNREKLTNIARTKILRKMVGEGNTFTWKSKVDLTRLPPCQAALRPHIQRVNHRVCHYKRANEAIIECPKPFTEGQGWVKSYGCIEPLWSHNPVLPTTLVDLLEQQLDEAENEKEDTDVSDFESCSESEDEGY